jgi:tetratricopeptide (TPR) repeat protein
MKKTTVLTKVTPSVIFLYLSIIPSIFGQKAMTIKHNCNFASAEKEGELYTYDPSKEAIEIVNKIMKVNVLTPNFIIKAADCSNALATTEGKERYILYNMTFLENFKKDAQTSWAAYSVFAHEIGHHFSNHDLSETDMSKRKVAELEADKFAGAVMYKLGANLLEAQAGIKTFALEGDSKTHPSAKSRLSAIAVGWSQAKDMESNKEEIKGELRLVTEADRKKAKEIVAEAQKVDKSGKYNYNDNVRTKYFSSEYQKAIDLDPNYAEAYFEYAKIKYGDERITLLDKVIELNPSFAEAYYEKAQMTWKITNNYDAYLSLLDKVIILNPAHADAYFHRNFIHRQKGNHLKALEDISKVISLKTVETWETPQYYVSRAVTYTKLKKIDEALADYDTYLKLKIKKAEEKDKNKESADIYLNCHVCSLLEGNQIARAEEFFLKNAEQVLRNTDYTSGVSSVSGLSSCFERYIRNLPQNDRIKLNQKLSNALYTKATQEADTLAAITFLRVAIDFEPSINARLLLGSLLLEFNPTTYSGGNLNHALEQFEKILDVDPMHLEAHYKKNWAFAHSYKYDSDNMLRNFEGKIKVESFSDVSDYLGFRGFAALGADGYVESLKEFDKALNLNPKCSIAWSGKSWASYELGKYAESLDYAKKALEINPKAFTPKKKIESKNKSQKSSTPNESAEEWLNKAKKSSTKSTSAELCKRAIELKPDFAEAYLLLATNLAYLDKKDLAIENFNKAIKLQPQNLEAYEGLGNVMEREIFFNQLDLAIPNSPISAQLYVLKGQTDIRIRHDEDALVCFDKAIAKNPTLETAYIEKGCLLVKLKKYKEALDPLNKVLKINPNSEKAQKCRQEALTKM